MTWKWGKNYKGEGIRGTINWTMKEVTGGGGREWGVENYSSESFGGGSIYKVKRVWKMMKKRKKYSTEEMAWRTSRKWR
jgi:hypothetical protein